VLASLVFIMSAGKGTVVARPGQDSLSGFVHIGGGCSTFGSLIEIWKSGAPAAKALSPETRGLLYLNVDTHFREAIMC